MKRTLLTLAATAGLAFGTTAGYGQFVPSQNPISQQGSMNRQAGKGQYGARDGSQARPQPQDGTGRGAKSGQRNGSGDCTNCTGPSTQKRSRGGSGNTNRGGGGRGGRG
jgi:hypothetical protein